MKARPNFAKTKRGASGGFLPRPLLLRLRHPNSEKRNQPKFCGILSPENCFRKTSSALFQISSSGLLSKKVRILSRTYRKYKRPFIGSFILHKIHYKTIHTHTTHTLQRFTNHRRAYIYNFTTVLG